MNAPNDSLIELRERMEAWISSPEGKHELEKAAKESAEIIKELQDARKIDWTLLNTPMDV